MRMPSRSATATEPTISAMPTPASTSQAVSTPLETSPSGTNTSTMAICPVLIAVGASSAEPPVTSVMEARPSCCVVVRSF